MSVGSSWPPHLAILFNFQPPSTGVNSSVLASRDFPAIFSDLFPVHHLNKAATRLSTELNSLRTVIPPDSHWINLIPEACRGAQLRQCSPPHTQKCQASSLQLSLLCANYSVCSLEFLPNQFYVRTEISQSRPLLAVLVPGNHAQPRFLLYHHHPTTFPSLYLLKMRKHNVSSSRKQPKITTFFFRKKAAGRHKPPISGVSRCCPPPSEPGFYFRTTEAPHSGADIAYTISCSREQVKFYALPSKFDFWTSGELHYGSIIRSLNFQKLRLWRVVKAAKPKFNFSRSRKSCMYSAFFPAADALRIIHSSKAVKILCRRREPTARRNWPVHFDFSTFYLGVAALCLDKFWFKHVESNSSFTSTSNAHCDVFNPNFTVYNSGSNSDLVISSRPVAHFVALTRVENRKIPLRGVTLDASRSWERIMFFISKHTSSPKTKWNGQLNVENERVVGGCTQVVQSKWIHSQGGQTLLRGGTWNRTPERDK
ncbi:hypothetical protein C8R43DRAFT_965570 [Mycena crocata]|nr:hypothetical protein C8R43DRAFT_965570 [Mycena crocata]